MNTIIYESELEHHGVKGMKWGVRRKIENYAARKKALNRRNSNYSKGQRSYDARLYGTKGTQRINRDMNKGYTREQAKSKELKRFGVKKRAERVLGLIGGMTIADIVVNDGANIKAIGRLAVTTILKAKGHTNIVWYD